MANKVTRVASATKTLSNSAAKAKSASAVTKSMLKRVENLSIKREVWESTELALKWTPKTGQQFKWDTVTRNGVNHDRDQKAQRSPAGVQSQGGA